MLQHKKPKDTIQSFCDETGHNHRDMELIITAFYKEVNRLQSTMELDGIELPGIGRIFIKVWTLKRRILTNRKALETGTIANGEKNPWNLSEKKKKRIQDETELLERTYARVTAKFNEIMDERVGKGKLRKQKQNTDNDTEGEITTGMGQQESDS